MSQNANQTKRYWIDDHSAIEDNDGKWVLHSDHAALVQQGIRDHADWRSKLNFLEADYKAEIARLTAEKEAETRATFDAIRTITQLRDDYAALAAENEQLKAAGLTLAESSDNAIWSLKQQLAVAEAKVAWLQKAEHLVIWDGDKWMPRPDMPRTSLPATHKSE